MGSSGTTDRSNSGAKLGTPENWIFSPSVRVSPMRRLPWLGMPMMSPGQASSAVSRSWARNHAPFEMARGDAEERDPVAVLGVHVGLDLEHEARDLGLVRRHHAGASRAASRRRG
jgi:hypothetical protein